MSTLYQQHMLSWTNKKIFIWSYGALLSASWHQIYFMWWSSYFSEIKEINIQKSSCMLCSTTDIPVNSITILYILTTHPLSKDSVQIFHICNNAWMFKSLWAWLKKIYKCWLINVLFHAEKVLSIHLNRESLDQPAFLHNVYMCILWMMGLFIEWRDI